MNYFSSNLKFLIKKFDTTQAHLASYIDVGQNTISNWVKEISTPDLISLIGIHQYFGISIDFLVFENLSNGKVVTDRHVQEFKRNSKVIGKDIGKVQALSKPYLVEENDLKNLVNEPESVVAWGLMAQLKLTHEKLDQLRLLSEQILKKGSK